MKKKLDSPSILDKWKLPPGYSIQHNGPWVSVVVLEQTGEFVHQGWKLHLSARPDTLYRTMDKAIPILLEDGCEFKVIASIDLLKEINAGMHGSAAIGKAITIYPNQATINQLAQRLTKVLTGFEAPQINSDRRIDSNAPVYYRFGPFLPKIRISNMGASDIILSRPDGTLISGLATEYYWSPDWADDPFLQQGNGTQLPRSDGELLIGDHFKIVGAIARTYRGTSYRAIDLRSGLRVVIKEAKAYIETSDGDTRNYLRNELRVLNALAGVTGTPDIMDHFAYGPDEFLVTTDLGLLNLRDYIIDFGVFSCDYALSQNVLSLARSLLQILDRIHQRGVIYRDLAPKNIVALYNGGWGLVDFELSRFEDFQCFGWSPGYASSRQRLNESATIEDDYFALGMTMFHALTGIDPIIIGNNAGKNIERTISCLVAISGVDPFIVSIIKKLIDPDPLAQDQAVNAIRNQAPFIGKKERTTRYPNPPIGLIFRHTLKTVLQHAKSMIKNDFIPQSMPPTITAYEGTAGVIMELSQYADSQNVALELAILTANVAESVATPTSLLYGRMGIALALNLVAYNSGNESLSRRAANILPNSDDLWKESYVDVTHGIAGLGIGYLAFAASAPEAQPYLLLADQCAERLLNEVTIIDEQLNALSKGNPAHGISIADGFAHGRAGIAYFLLAHAAQRGNKDSAAKAFELLFALSKLIPDIVKPATSRSGRPMAASWCQGLSGIGTAMLRGGCFFKDESFLYAAEVAAKACLDIAPRVPLVTQCCGLAGIGELMIDLSIITRNIKYHQSAIQILNIMLSRSGGTRTKPYFPDSSLAAITPGWANGAGGVLSYLRRLADPSSQRLWMVDEILLQN
jgi:serine/threonine protein kinase